MYCENGKLSPHPVCRAYLVGRSPPFSVSLIPMWMFEALGVSRPLGATEAGNGAGLFQVLGQHLQDAGHLVRHCHALCLQDLYVGIHVMTQMSHVKGIKINVFVFTSAVS